MLLPSQIFDGELAYFAAEATRIIKEFSGGWYGKTLHSEGGFGTAKPPLSGRSHSKRSWPS